MAKTCIQCGKKIGLFQKAVDGIYCSLDCAATAQKDIAEKDRLAQIQRVEAERQAEQEAKEAEARWAAQQAAEQLLRTCPKCGSAWEFAPGGGEGGANAGKCPSCTFTAEFTAIEKCPSCNGMTLLVESGGSARCPRCKYRS